MATNPGSSDAATQRIEAALSQIQPIRDLARNWDVDIASCLQDYLEDIAGDLAVDEDHEPPSGGTGTAEDATPNFAQAALLVQNSSNVYSRKVEYLYSLVYSALEDLVSSTGQQASMKSRARTTDADIEDFDAFDPDVHFLLLDDVLPTDNTHKGDKINLVEQDHDDDQDLLGFGAHVSGSRTSLTRPSDRTSIGNSAAQRALLGTLHPQGSDTAGGNLRLLHGRCDMDDSGILLMPGTFQFSSRNSMGGVHTDQVVQGGAQDDADFGNHIDEADGGGFHMMHDDDEPMPSVAPPSAAPHSSTAATRTAPNKADPWSLLDPHDPGRTKSRPLRVGITYRLPEGIDEPPSKFVTGAHTRRQPPTRASVERTKNLHQSKPTVCIATETFKATMASERRRRQTRISHVAADDSSAMSIENINDVSHVDIERPHVPLKGLIFGDEFQYIAKAAAKRKAAERRERRKLLSQDPQAVASQEADQLLGFGDHDDDDQDDEDFGAFDNGDDDGSVGDAAFGNEKGPGPIGGTNTGFASVGEAFGSYDVDERDTSNVEALEFEALCRAHIRAFARGAEKYAAETNLTRRVDEWQARLAPILEEEDERPEFDIHRYSDHVIQVVKTQVDDKSSAGGKTPKSVNFQSLTRKSKQFEVCRIFLASLSLSNSGNVAFNAEEGSVATPDSLQLELLDSSIERPMTTYLAPSAQPIVQ